MPDDLEDFLKRAAARRQAKTAAPAAPKPQPAAARPSQPYTDRRTERQIREVDVEVDADRVSRPIEAVILSDPAGESLARQRKQIEAAKRKANRLEAKAKAEHRIVGTAASPAAGSLIAQPTGMSQTGPTQPVAAFDTQDVGGSLRRLLRQPGGLQQAFLLREILDRPEHRW